MRPLGLLVLAIAMGMGVCPPLQALTAREILDKAKGLDDTTRHWTDRRQHMTLHIYSAGGSERRREMQIYSKRYPNDEDKTLSFFLSPPEVKGTAFLQWAHKARDDDQWLYLPEFRRIRQITAQLREESFMGTDFTYRDLEILGEIQGWSEADASSKLLGEEPLGDSPCYMIELHPKLKDVAYDHIVVWTERDRLMLRKLEFYDREKARAKTLALDDVRDIGPIPTVQRLEMQDLKKGSRTVVEIADVTYDSGLSDDLFTQRYLERGAP